MILIISQHLGEYTTDSVIDWLDRKNANYYRINGNDFIENCSFYFDVEDVDVRMKFSEIQIDFSEIKVFWYRRWLPESYFFSNYEKLTDDVYSKIRISRHLKNELWKIRDYISSIQNNKHWLSSIEHTTVNKLEVLRTAKECDLRIPKTIVTNDKNDVLQFKKKFNSVIVKAIGEALMVSIYNKSYSGYTSLLDDEMLDRLPEKFYPSLFQETVDKEYELRVFYLDNQFYSMAIFSQNDDRTRVDFRNYNLSKPNRTVPFNLPVDIEVKLTKLMEELGLNTGSIDLIKSKSGEFVFLEINPMGQFGMVSEPCNYHLEEKVADYLIKKESV